MVRLAASTSCAAAGTAARSEISRARAICIGAFCPNAPRAFVTGSSARRRALPSGARLGIASADEVRGIERVEVGPLAILPVALGAFDLPRTGLLERARDLVFGDAGTVDVHGDQRLGRAHRGVVGLRRLVHALLHAAQERA